MNTKLIKQREELYEQLLEDLGSVLADETDEIIWMATASCLLKNYLGFFWVGFYRLIDGELRIGPYQGTLGCLRIPLDKGVCGTAASSKKTVVVPDVHEFPGHIACDSRSESEIVVPVLDGSGEVRAVLDVDSDRIDDFTATDQKYLERLVEEMRGVEWKRGS